MSTRKARTIRLMLTVADIWEPFQLITIGLLALAGGMAAMPVNILTH